MLPPLPGDVFAGAPAPRLPPGAAAAAAAAARVAAGGGGATARGGPATTSTPAGAAPPAVPPASASAFNTRIRCLCGVATDKGVAMVQCGVAGCGVWQHAECVLPPGAPVPPSGSASSFACEACRLADADPFWVPASPADCPGLAACTGGGVQAGRLAWRGPAPGHAPGADPGSGVVFADWAFTLSEAAVAALRARPDALRLQLACLALGDGPDWPGAATGGYGGGPGPGGGGVPGRVHWPRFADVRASNHSLPLPHRRHAHDPLAARGRDAPIDVPAALLRVGVNRLYAAGIEPARRPFAAVARVVAAVPLAAVLSSPPPLEPLAAALARVRAAVAGDDPDLVVEASPLPLRCPLSGGRLVTPVRIGPGGPGGAAAARGLPAFDWASYVEMGSRSRRWVCPHSMHPAPLRALVRDAFVSAVLAATAHTMPEAVEVEVGADGRWRAGPASPWRSVLEEGGGEAPPVGAAAAATAARQRRSSASASGGAAAGPPPPFAPQAPVKTEAASPAAAAAAAAAARPSPPTEVILISSEEDEEDVPLAARGAARGAAARRTSGPGAAAPTAPASARAGGGGGGGGAPPPPHPHPPIRVALPPRGARPAVDAAAAAAAAAAEARSREGAAMQRLLTSFVSALTQASSPDRGATVAAAAAHLVASGTASPERAAAMAGRAWDAAAATLRTRGGGGGGGVAPTPPSERAAAAAAAASARARLAAADAGVRARVQAMAVGAAAARAGVENGGGGV